MDGDRLGLARALRERRAALGLTQVDAAVKCGVSASTYAAIERAERRVRDGTLHDLGLGLGFDAAAAYWTPPPSGGESYTIEGNIRRIERTETDDGHFRTVFEVPGPAGTWTITQERANPPGPLRAGEPFTYRADWTPHRT